MKAVVVNEPGGPEVLTVSNIPKPHLKKGWSLIQVKGFGINRSEIFTRQGLSPSVKFPRVLGIECVGIIAETTDEKHLPRGQKVISIMGEMGRKFNGSYAEFVLVPNRQIYPIETKLNWQTLATIPETYYTAYGSLLNLKITTKDKVLVRAATSGVGTAFVKLLKAKYPNIEVTGSTRNIEKDKLLLEVGFDRVILDKDGKLETDQKYDKVLELIGPAIIKDTFKHVNENGIICSTGQLGYKWYIENFDPIMDLAANSYLTSFYSGNVSTRKLNQLLKYLEDYHIQVEPVKIFKLDEVIQAHKYMESSKSFGKVIVIVDE